MIIVIQIVIKKNRNKLYDLYNNIVLSKFAYSNKYKNNFLFGNYK